jgi:hypothetical protein
MRRKTASAAFTARNLLHPGNALYERKKLLAPRASG